MKNAVRLNDLTTGHSCFPPQKIVECSPNVFVNGRGVVCSGHKPEKHICTPMDPGHTGPIAPDKPPKTVFVNGKRPAKIMDPVKGACGGMVMTGSSNVFFGE